MALLLFDVQHIKTTDHKALSGLRTFRGLNEILLGLVCSRRNGTDGADENVHAHLLKGFGDSVGIIVVHLEIVYSALRGSFLL